MGFKLLELKLPTNYSTPELENKIKKKIKTSNFSYTIEKKSLDARKKNDILWNIKVGVSSPNLRGPSKPETERLTIPFQKRDKKIIVTGSGPAGFFAAYVLLEAGFDVTIIEKGGDVKTRSKEITAFEQTGVLNENNNYAFGEGGAGTFSDGKLTSRTKTISKERRFIFDTYIQNGAPGEIAFLSHPHLGSDNLRLIVENLRNMFLEKGGTIRFNTRVTDVEIKNNRMTAVDTTDGKMDAHWFVFATGHSVYDTYRMLIRKGIPFQSKSFALGCRVEHRQTIINEAQWGTTCLPGVKAAEYRLTHKTADQLPVYSFCMCPGGKVVPAAPYRNLNIVNGMSNYKRNSPFANAAIVAAVNLEDLLGRTVDPLESLEWLEKLEEGFHRFSGGYDAPACKISDFLAGNVSAACDSGSYPFKLIPADFDALFSQRISLSLREGMQHFPRLLKGFDEGIMLGLESKTSAPIQAIRDKDGRCSAVENLSICGEGSGWAGGIVSSAADGIKSALAILSYLQ